MLCGTKLVRSAQSADPAARTRRRSACRGRCASRAPAPAGVPAVPDAGESAGRLPRLAPGARRATACAQASMCLSPIYPLTGRLQRWIPHCGPDPPSGPSGPDPIPYRNSSWSAADAGATVAAHLERTTWARDQRIARSHRQRAHQDGLRSPGIPAHLPVGQTKLEQQLRVRERNGSLRETRMNGLTSREFWPRLTMSGAEARRQHTAERRGVTREPTCSGLRHGDDSLSLQCNVNDAPAAGVFNARARVLAPMRACLP